VKGKSTKKGKAASAEDELRKALDGKLSGEARKRITRILEAGAHAAPPPDQLRELRATLAELVGNAAQTKLP